MVIQPCTAGAVPGYPGPEDLFYRGGNRQHLERPCSLMITFDRGESRQHDLLLSLNTQLFHSIV